MDHATEMSAMADQWADSLGGQMAVELWVWVRRRTDGKTEKNYLARIGDQTADGPNWFGHGRTLAESMAIAERDWVRVGKPPIEEARLADVRDRAAKLGYRLEKTTEPKLDPAAEQAIATP